MKTMFDQKGNVIASGYFSHMIFNYKKKYIRASENKIKEWDFYQFQDGNYVIQFTIAHALIFDNYFACIFNIKTKESFAISKLFLHSKKSLVLIDNPEEDYRYDIKKKDFHFAVSNVLGHKDILFTAKTKKYPLFQFHLWFDSVNEANRITMLHKFDESEKMFYLNYKENFFNVKCDIAINDFKFKSETLGGMIDFGRGYWPFVSRWYWGSFSKNIDGENIGWNLGYGFGNCKETENIIYINNESTKLGYIHTTIDDDNPWKDIVIDDQEGKLHLEMTPIYDNFTKTKVLWINKWCHQVYYKTNGYITNGQRKIDIKEEISFFEHEENRW